MKKETYIIPKPAKVITGKGFFDFIDEIVCKSHPNFKQITSSQIKQINELFGSQIRISEIESKQVFKIEYDKEFHLEEAYKLKIEQEGITLSSKTNKGIFYGFQSLKQLLFSGLQIPCSIIEDYPRFQWRGYMLDEARHFFGKDEVKKILDIMALYKLNKFHWHLTDDQGWRLEIEKYPLLNKISSRRKGTSTDKRKLMSDLQKDKTKIDEIPVSGLYNKKQIREIIKYAKDRFITIIPEIDFPGHVQAVLAAYPELSCTGGPFEVSPNFGVHKDVFCIGKEKVFDFSRDIINEVIDLFPSSKIIHLGGDEVPTRRFKKCPDCQNLIKKEGLKNEKQLQPYYTSKMVTFFKEKDRNLMGWNEILNEDLSEDSICQYWAGDFDLAIEHVKKGRKTVMSDMRFVYLNYPEQLTPLKKSYEYDPIPSTLHEDYHNHILGIESCLWSEYVPDIKTLETQVFPRLLAIAETGWTLKNNKDYKSFETRLQKSLNILEKLNVKYSKSE